MSGHLLCMVCTEGISTQQLLLYSPAARGGNLAKIPPNQVIADFGRGSSVESESEWCPAGIIERFVVIQDGVQYGDAVLKHAYFGKFMSDFYIVIHVFWCFKSQQIHLDRFQSNKSIFSASKDIY